MKQNQRKEGKINEDDGEEAVADEEEVHQQENGEEPRPDDRESRTLNVGEEKGLRMVEVLSLEQRIEEEENVAGRTMTNVGQSGSNGEGCGSGQHMRAALMTRSNNLSMKVIDEGGSEPRNGPYSNISWPNPNRPQIDGNNPPSVGSLNLNPKANPNDGKGSNLARTASPTTSEAERWGSKLRRLIQEETEDRRRHNLNVRCDALCDLGHVCQNPQMHARILGEGRAAFEEEEVRRLTHEMLTGENP